METKVSDADIETMLIGNKGDLTMELNFMDAEAVDFEPQIYIRILVAIAKADKDNGPPEFEFVRRQAQRVGIDYDRFLESTDKHFTIKKRQLSRLTALVILKDAILLASLDRNFSLPEKQRVYTYAEKLDISRNDVDALETLINEYRRLNDQWQQLVNQS